MTRLAAPTDSRVARDLIGVGLAPYQARVLVALVVADDPLDSTAIAARSGVPRTSVYAAAAWLVANDLAWEVARERGPAVWAAGGWDDTVQRLTEWAARSHGVTLGRIDQLRAHVR